MNLNKNERLRSLFFAISYNNRNAAINDGAMDNPARGPYTATYINQGAAAQSLYLGMLFRAATMLQCNFGGHTFTLNQ